MGEFSPIRIDFRPRSTLRMLTFATWVGFMGLVASYGIPVLQNPYAEEEAKATRLVTALANKDTTGALVDFLPLPPDETRQLSANLRGRLEELEKALAGCQTIGITRTVYDNTKNPPTTVTVGLDTTCDDPEFNVGFVYIDRVAKIDPKTLTPAFQAESS